jgi:hypothetical protein
MRGELPEHLLLGGRCVEARPESALDLRLLAALEWKTCAIGRNRAGTKKEANELNNVV